MPTSAKERLQTMYAELTKGIQETGWGTPLEVVERELRFAQDTGWGAFHQSHQDGVQSMRERVFPFLEPSEMDLQDLLREPGCVPMKLFN